MTMYRITIEKEKDGSPDERGYKNWDEIYQQVTSDVEVSKLINLINEPRPVTVKQ